MSISIEVAVSVHRALRLLRVYHDLNQKDVAETLGLSKSYVSELESGRKRPTLEVLDNYAMTFDLPLSSLMLFIEASESSVRKEKARAFVADKTLHMLEWIERLGSDTERAKDG